MLSSVEKLSKFIRLEVERGYDNRAVVGGLDKILPSWESEARANQLPDEIIQTVITGLKSYPTLEPADRAAMLQGLKSQLEQAVPQRAAPQAAAGIPDNGSPSSPDLKRQRPARETGAPPVQSRPGARTYSPAPAPVESGAEGLNASTKVLPGVGNRISQTLSTLGLNTLEDLLYYFPRRYDDYSQLKPINRLAYGEVTTVLGTIQNIFTRPIRGGKMQMTEAVITDGTGSIRVNWFNQPWLAGKFSSGTQVVLAGKIDQYLGRLTMTNPEMEAIEQEHLHTNRIVPVYPLTAGLNQKNLRRIMHQTVSYWAQRVPEYLPERVRSAVKVVSLSAALMNIHFPESQDMLDVARWRLAFDEIFLLQLGVLRQKRTWQAVEARVFETSQEWLDQQTGRLPYQLTGAQQRVIGEIRQDITSGRPMNRLIQGDVGSGKTVVAALAIAAVTSQGAQAAVMAPTSILAEQHYRTLTRLLTQPVELPTAEMPEDGDGVAGDEVADVDVGDNVASEGAVGEPIAREIIISEPPLHPEQVRLLIGDTAEAEKQEIREGLANGSVKVIIGTHALLEGPVEFQELELAVIDEQHRFGVAQRATLRSKGTNPHLLVMTATPIPRSLALTVYGDLDVSVMDEMPAGRLPVETYVLRPVERERAYQLIRSQIEQGRQAFIVYPLVEQSDVEENGEGAQAPGTTEATTPAASASAALSPASSASAASASVAAASTGSDGILLSAVEEQKRLQEKIFPKLKVGLLHGRMKPEEKDQVMKTFRDRAYDVLVSTTVIEVGVDIPNATVMLIEGANRFGLAQLHQLRGRVGRGGNQAFCLLIPDHEDAVENERLAVMSETNDGFVLAEHDLQQRGPGDFLGTRQAGFSELKMANLTDVRLIEKARQQALAIFQEDPDLSSPLYGSLAKKLEQFWGGGRGDIS